MNEIENFFQNINNTAIKHFEKLGVSINEIRDLSIEEIKFYDVTAYISVSGAIRGGFIFSVEKQLANTLVPKVIYGELSEEEIPEYASDVIAEMTNMISANSLNDREEEDVFLGTPLMILGNAANIKNISMKTVAKNYITPNGQFRCIFIHVEKGTELKIEVV